MTTLADRLMPILQWTSTFEFLFLEQSSGNQRNTDLTKKNSIPIMFSINKYNHIRVRQDIKLTLLCQYTCKYCPNVSKD